MFGLVDCNNFYASCERVFNPKLNNKPIVVLSNNDGCVIARSNEAKSLGIKMGEPAFKISSLIKKYNIKIFSTNFALYGDMSRRVMSIIASSIPNIEIYSIDEAFLDSNHISKKNPKYKGVFIMGNNNEDTILKNVQVEKIWGVGLKTKVFLKHYGINTAMQLKKLNSKWMRKHQSIVGERTIKELSGIICYDINSSFSSKKSICTSRTFGKMVTSLNDLSSSISMYTVRCAEKLRSQNSSAMLAHVFVSTNPFRKDLEQYTNYKTINFPVPTNDTSEMLSCILKTLKMMYKNGYKYKRAGVVVSGIIPNSQVQCDIFDTLDRSKSSHIMNTIDNINHKLGRDSIRYASQGYYRKWKLKQECLSPSYTTRWNNLLTINV